MKAVKFLMGVVSVVGLFSPLVYAERVNLFEDDRVRVTRTTFLPGIEVTRPANPNTRWVIPIESDVVLRETRIESSAPGKKSGEKKSRVTWSLGQTYMREPEDKTKLLEVRYLNESSKPMTVITFQIKEK